MIGELSIDAFLEKLQSKAPTPGGGGASALAGAQGVCLGMMVGNLTTSKKKYEAFEPRLRVLMEKLEAIKRDFLFLAEEDERVFSALAKTYALPKEQRAEAMEPCLEEASLVPIRVMEKACEALQYLRELGEHGSRLALSDVGVGVQFLQTAISGAVMNVYINTRFMQDRERAAELNGMAGKLLDDGTHQVYEIYQKVEAELCGN